jgi:hypothetical protein
VRFDKKRYQYSILDEHTLLCPLKNVVTTKSLHGLTNQQNIAAYEVPKNHTI